MAQHRTGNSMPYNSPQVKKHSVNSMALAVTAALLLIFVGTDSISATETDSDTSESTDEEDDKVELQVTLDDVRDDVGTIYIGVYKNEEEWKKREPSSGTTTKPTSPRASATIELAPGEYALSAYHDVNEDEEFNRKGLLRLPAEPFAFSNDPTIRTGMPGWKRVKFEVKDEETKITLTLKHPKGDD